MTTYNDTDIIILEDENCKINDDQVDRIDPETIFTVAGKEPHKIVVVGYKELLETGDELVRLNEVQVIKELVVLTQPFLHIEEERIVTTLNFNVDDHRHILR